MVSRSIASTAGVLRREQVVGLEQGGVGRGDLVAVDGVHQPHRRGQLAHEAIALGGREATRVGELPQPGLHLVEAGDSLARGHDQHLQRAPFPGLGVGDQAGAIGGRGVERLQVGGDAVRRRDLLSPLVADDLPKRRDGRVVARARRERRQRARAGRVRSRPRRNRPEAWATCGGAEAGCVGVEVEAGETWRERAISSPSMVPRERPWMARRRSGADDTKMAGTRVGDGARPGRSMVAGRGLRGGDGFSVGREVSPASWVTATRRRRT